MKTKIGIFLLSLFCQFCMAQTLTRKPLHGQVVNDNVKIENGVVFNLNSKSGAAVKENGFFVVSVKINDTLLISSLGFKSRKIIITDTNIKSPLLRVRMEVHTNQLTEVLIFAKKWKNPVEGKSQEIVDMQYVDDEKSSPKNIAMPPDGSIDKGTDFVRIYKDVLTIFRKNNPDKIDYSQGFSDFAMSKIGYDFFTNTLKLKDDEIGLFLIFSENDPKAKTVLKNQNEFELIEFLVTKNKEFKRMTTFDK
ncbi:hypothetical protein [Flavobacterium sp. K5-23]|uniref:hypothetical protein n=1 Tax=Flavobacterium sp. K5-23 TaxID=2746225 RepID=UPI00200D1AFD|nr:hypothetical protein [Flavobacterium sp. K5-23]UQD55077.1 hypothetical protein FLAK523_01205 [Flavobacterium sp. K5-23]